MKTYQSTVIWDETLIDVECTNSGSASGLPLELQGLVVSAKKMSGTTPDTVIGVYAQGATVLNLATGVWYRNTGTTATPVFSVWAI